MSGPVVFIGFILLIPSVLGVIFSALMFFGVLSSADNTGESDRITREVRASMQDYVPTLLIDAVIDGRNDYVDSWIRQEYIDHGNPFQIAGARDIERRVREAQERLRSINTTSGIGVIVGTGVSIAFGVASFVGGLLGWLLVMRKRVLQCSVCNAVLNAS